MKRLGLENTLLSVTASPVLKSLIGQFDVDCPTDGNLILNSLRQYLGAPVILCPTCQHKSTKAAAPVYELGSRFLRASKEFMRSEFFNNDHGESWLRGFGLMMKGASRFGLKIPFTPAAPFQIVWNLTYKCNLKCKHCYEDAGGKQRTELSTEEAKQVLDKLSKVAGIGLPALSFSGGEPLAREDFFELAAYAQKRIGYVAIATNGTLITKEAAAKLKEAGVGYAEISIDGATAGVHDTFRGVPNAFVRSMDGVKNCIEAGIDTCIATVIHKDNLAELDGLMELADQLKVRFMHFNYIPTGRAKINIQYDLTPEERLHVLETIGKKIFGLYVQRKEEELRTGHSDISSDRFFSTCPQYAPVTRSIAHQYNEKFLIEAHYGAQKGVESAASFLGGCGCGRLYCCIEPNGDIKPCVFFPTNKHTIVGNMLRDDFDEVWSHSPLLQELRDREALQDCKINGKTVGCATCSEKYICGGCRARSYSYFNGNTQMPDIGCINNKPLWEILGTR